MVTRVAGQPAQRAPFGQVAADLGGVRGRIAAHARPEIDEAVGKARRRVEGGQQPVGQVARAGEQHRIAAGMMRGEQAADEPDRRLEHRHLAVDIDVEMRTDPLDAVPEAAVQAHHPQGVERLHEAEAEVMVLEREAGGGTADRPDLVHAPGVRAILVPGPAHLRLHLLAARTPVGGVALGAAGGVEGRHRQAGEPRPHHLASADRHARPPAITP